MERKGMERKGMERKGMERKDQMAKENFTFAIPENVKTELKNMSDDTGLSMAQLAVMAIHSLTANYKLKGSFIFADLLNPDKSKK